MRKVGKYPKLYLFPLNILVARTEIASWTRQTIEVAALLDKRGNRPERVAAVIRDFMTPLLASVPHDPTKKAPAHYKQHEDRISQLCADAYRLSLLMRKCRARYECVEVEANTIIDERLESEIIAQDFEGPQAPQVRGSRIAFTVFGALVKTPEPALNRRLVLQKAHVICRV